MKKIIIFINFIRLPSQIRLAEMHTLSTIQALSHSAYDPNSNFYKREMNLLCLQICRKYSCI